MGITSSHEEFPSISHSSLNDIESEISNAPQIYINKEILINAKHESPSNIISEYLKSTMNLPNKDKTIKQKLYQYENTNSTLNQKTFQNSTSEQLGTNSSDSSESDNNSTDTNSNINLLQNSSISMNIKKLYNLDDSIDEPIKTMAGSLLKDIRYIYKFKDLLGGGHFGSVRVGFRRAEQLPRRLYAIKSISKQNLSEKDIENLTKEVDIISTLDHPNIIKFYETYHDKFYFHIVMES